MRRNVGRRRRVDVGRRRIDDVRRSGRPRHVGLSRMFDHLDVLKAQGAQPVMMLDHVARLGAVGLGLCASNRVIARFFHAWEHRLASVTHGLASSARSTGASTGSSRTGTPASDTTTICAWSGGSTRSCATRARSSTRRRRATTSSMQRTRFAPEGEAGTLRFPSALVTPHPENNTVVARWFPARAKHAVDATRRATRPRRRGAAAVELRRRGHMSACRDCWRDSASRRCV